MPRPRIYKNERERREMGWLKERPKRAEKRRLIRKLIWGWKATHPCVRCGEADPRCLQFHHLRDKETDVTGVARRWTKLSRLWEEIEKCIMLCANCHAKEHAKGPEA